MASSREGRIKIERPFPVQIRVLGFTRVTKSFEARRLCDRRRYEYILPTFAFDPACCRGAEIPLAHVGAAGNIVEKHAGRELDLEAALKALPGAESSIGSAAQTASEKPKERQQDEAQHGSSGPLQSGNGGDALGNADSLASLSAQPGNGLQSSEAPQEQANPLNQGSISAVPHTSTDQESNQPQGAPSDSREQQHHSSNGQPDPQAANCNQQPSAGPPDQQTGNSAAGRSVYSRHAARHHIPEHYKSIRFTQEQQARLNKVLSGYVGTHNFHNYTVRVSPDDPAAMRYILSFKCEGTMEIQV